MTQIIAALVLGSTLSHAYAPQNPAVNADAQVLPDFKERVDKYVELRKKVDGAPTMKKTDDATELRLAQQGLAERIGAARSPGKQGEILTPEIAASFRKLLRPDAKDPGTNAAIKDDNPGNIPFTSC